LGTGERDGVRLLLAQAETVEDHEQGFVLATFTPSGGKAIEVRDRRQRALRSQVRRWAIL
jgi:hypothetical protein